MFICILITGLLFQCKPPAAYREESGFEWAIRVESGHPVAVMMTVYRTTMLADGKDRTLIRVAVTDSALREITSAQNTIRIYCDGDASILPTREGEELKTGTDTGGLEYAPSGLVPPIRLDFTLGDLTLICEAAKSGIVYSYFSE